MWECKVSYQVCKDIKKNVGLDRKTSDAFLKTSNAKYVSITTGSYGRFLEGIRDVSDHIRFWFAYFIIKQ